jgi:nucleotide-binding universal stress UspA family protein
MFSRILVPTDFSPPSDAALEYARILAAAKFGSSLRILHVIDDPTASSDYVADRFAPSTEDIRTRLVEHARKRLDHLMNLVDPSRYHVHADAVLGLPAAAIVDYATATDTSLIVMGTHARTGLTHLLMDGVAEQVVLTAPCPVLTVRKVTVADEAVADIIELRVPDRRVTSRSLRDEHADGPRLFQQLKPPRAPVTRRRDPHDDADPPQRSVAVENERDLTIGRQPLSGRRASTVGIRQPTRFSSRSKL